MKPIRQILFVPPAPVVWANAIDGFARNSLVVETTPTLSSDQIGAGLADGTWDIGVGVVDNVIAWNSERKAGLKIIAQFERSTVMRFLCVPSYSSLSDAAANIIAVDSTSNGFVLVLYRALARAGIDWRTCRFERVGGVRQRFEAMQAGKAAAAILVPPFDGMARAQGFKQLWDGAEIAPHYPGVVAAARADWLAANDAVAAAYVRALKAANEWAARPENYAAARAALVAARYSEDTAERLVRELVPGLAPSRTGWEEVVTLRRECDLLPSPGPRWDDVVDTRFLAAAN